MKGRLPPPADPRHGAPLFYPLRQEYCKQKVFVKKKTRNY